MILLFSVLKLILAFLHEKNHLKFTFQCLFPSLKLYSLKVKDMRYLSIQ